MGFFSRFENKMEDAVDDLGDKLFDSPISPVQIAKKAEKQMRRNKMVGAGKQYAPTLYTVLVNPSDDARLVGYYPTLAGETETYLKAKANESGLAMDGDPLVRFIVDNDLKSGKFDVIAEAVASDIISQLRKEEIERYGINNQAAAQIPQQQQVASQQQQVPRQAPASSPFAPVDSQAVVNDAVQQQAPQAQPAVAQVPAPQAQPVPQPTPVPAPQQVPQQAPAPQSQPAVQPQVQNQQPVQNEVPSSSSPTAVFAGGLDVNNSVNANANAPVPMAHLRESSTGRVYTLNSATTVLGRETNCNIVLPDANASRQHAQITYNNGLWLVNDLGSTNGTFVNNQEITTREIHSGDVITIGVTHLTFNIA